MDMRWRIDQLSAGEDCLDKFPDLEERWGEEFQLRNIMVLQNLSNDQLVRYLIYAYHKQSPFVRKITDVKHRKNQALIQAGFDFKNGIPEDIQAVMNGENETVADMILKFLMGENSMKFSALMMQMDAYYRYNFQLAYGNVSNIKSHNAAIRELDESIEQLSQEVFSGDTELNNFVAGAKLRGMIITPEQFAHKKKGV